MLIALLCVTLAVPAVARDDIPVLIGSWDADEGPGGGNDKWKKSPVGTTKLNEINATLNQATEGRLLLKWRKNKDERWFNDTGFDIEEK